jgi:hypothetical protein
MLVDAVAEKAYRWVDAQGHVHYGDQPGKGAEVIKVRPGTLPPVAGKPAEKVPEPSAGASSSDAPPEDPRVVAQRRAADCGRRKEQLNTYRHAVRIVEKNSLGDEREYSAEEKERLIKLTEEQIAETCEEPP